MSIHCEDMKEPDLDLAIMALMLVGINMAYTAL